MSAHTGVQTSPLGESMLIHTLALALPSCVNTGEGWLCPEEPRNKLSVTPLGQIAKLQDA